LASQFTTNSPAAMEEKITSDPPDDPECLADPRREHPPDAANHPASRLNTARPPGNVPASRSLNMDAPSFV
jgi:hypothetical protein